MSEEWPEQLYLYDSEEPEGNRDDWLDESEPGQEWSDTVEPTEEDYEDSDLYEEEE